MIVWFTFGASVHGFLHLLYLLERPDVGFACVDTIFSAKKHIVGSKGEELGRHFGEAMPYGYHIHLALATAYHQLVYNLLRSCGKIGTAVVEYDDATFEVVQHARGPLWVEDVSAHAIEHKILFCPQFVHRIERIAVGICFVVLRIVWSDNQNALPCGCTNLFDEGGFARAIGTENHYQLTRSCGCFRVLLHHLLPQRHLLHQLLVGQRWAHCRHLLCPRPE